MNELQLMDKYRKEEFNFVHLKECYTGSVYIFLLLLML